MGVNMKTKVSNTKKYLLLFICIVVIPFVAFLIAFDASFKPIIIQLENIDKQDYPIFEKAFGVTLPETAVIEMASYTHFRESSTGICISGIKDPFEYIEKDCLPHIEAEYDYQEDDWWGTFHGDMKHLISYTCHDFPKYTRFHIYTYDTISYVEIYISDCGNELYELFEKYHKEKRDKPLK